jgi:hypothetical protein
MWATFTHSVDVQGPGDTIWSTVIPSGIGPFAIFHASRWT